MLYKTFNKILLTIGFISLLHTAYSAAQRKFIFSKYFLCINCSEQKYRKFITDRSYLRVTDQEKTNAYLPFDVISNI